MRRAVAKFMPSKFARSPSDPPENSYRLDHASVDEFYINTDDPHKSWAPGDEISGQVILRSRKNLANIAIAFNLSGYVKIHASPHSKLRPMKTVLFSHTIRIYGPNADLGPAHEFANGLYKGEHRFPFIVKLPNKRIFTSIDFGKGAIVYVLSANLTSADAAVPAQTSSPGPSPASGSNTPEPSSLSKAKEAFSKIHHPSYSYEKIINLVNPIDVAHLPPPKRKRLIIKNPRKGKTMRVQSSNSTINTFVTVSSANSDVESVTNPHTTQSLDTSVSASNSQLQPVQATSPSNSASGTSTVQHSKSPDTIRVSMDVAQRGYLRGELIPIKLSINHLRKIQDSTGIIVTLVRVCRIDYGPDGYYESFRKDLQQSVIPLFVDPNTFSSEISTSVRVPPDAFPTISGCPLVSFQYFIEVMLNLSGKSLSLTTPSEQPKSNMVPGEETSSGLSPGHTQSNFNFSSLAHSRSEYINTDKFKRSKKFLQMTTEVVIGTYRSVKTTDDTPTTDAAQTGSLNSGAQSQAPVVTTVSNGTPMAPINPVPELRSMDNFESPPYLFETSRPEETQANPSRHIPTYADVAIAPPEPELPQLTEKERMRQHEASLLPSAPPLDDSSSESELGADGEENALNGSEVRNYGVEVHSDVGSTAHSQGTLGARVHELSSDELYQAPDIHEGIGSEGNKEYVPNYDAAAHDRLVDSNQ